MRNTFRMHVSNLISEELFSDFMFTENRKYEEGDCGIGNLKLIYYIYLMHLDIFETLVAALAIIRK